MTNFRDNWIIKRNRGALGLSPYGNVVEVGLPGHIQGIGDQEATMQATFDPVLHLIERTTKFYDYLRMWFFGGHKRLYVGTNGIYHGSGVIDVSSGRHVFFVGSIDDRIRDGIEFVEFDTDKNYVELRSIPKR